MKDARLTIRLPAAELAFAKTYAREHNMTLAALVRRCFALLRSQDEVGVPDSVAQIAGLVPPDVDAKSEYADHVAGKR